MECTQEELKKQLERKYEYKVDSVAEELVQAKKDRDFHMTMVDAGLFDPVLPYFGFFGGNRSTYCSLPLNKKLYHEVLSKLVELGWIAGEVHIGSGSATCELRYDYNYYDGSKTVTARMYLSAYGDGVACKIVELKPVQEYREGVYEWICEEGAKEMEGKLAWD